MVVFIILSVVSYEKGLTVSCLLVSSVVRESIDNDRQSLLLLLCGFVHGVVGCL
jgi:hypothetical protein